MRRLLLILLVFLPGALAFWLFKYWNNEEPTAVRQVEGAGSESLGGEQSPFRGTAGRETFFIRREVGVDQSEYPAWYYHLGSWQRGEADVIEAERVYALHNDDPAEKREGPPLLEMGSEDELSDRLAKLEAALTTHTALKAQRARFHGGGRIEKADRMEFHDTVQLHVAARGSRPGFNLLAEMLEIRLAEGKVSRLDLPKAFNFEHPQYQVKGSGFRLEDGVTEYHIEKLDLLQLLDRKTTNKDRTRKLLITSNGSLVFKPSEAQLEDMAKAQDLLRKLRLDEGEFELDGGVDLEFDDFHLTADRLRGRILADRDDSGRITKRRFDRLVALGNVVVDSPDGELRGGRATVSLVDDRLDTVRVDEGPVAVKLGVLGAKKSAEDKNRVKRTLTAEAEGFVEIRARRSESGVLLGYAVRVEDTVVVDLDREGPTPIHAEGAVLVATIDMEETAGSKGDESVVNHSEDSGDTADRGLRRVARFRQAILDGGITGRADDFALSGSSLRISRRYTQGGTVLDDVAHLQGPARLTYSIDAAKDVPGSTRDSDQAGTVVLDAGDTVVLTRSASKLAPSRIDAVGACRLVAQRGAAPPLVIEGEALSLVAFTDMDQRKLSGRTFESLRSQGKARVTRGEELELTSDLIVAREGGAKLDVDGIEGPAKLKYVDSKGNRQHLFASKVAFDETTGKFRADGGVEARVYMTNFVLTGEKKAEVRRARENMDEPPDLSVAWDLTCGALIGGFTGSLGVSSRGGSKDPIVWRDLRAENQITLSNPDQSMNSREFYYDFVTGTGEAKGSPATFVSRRDASKMGSSGAARFENRLEAERIRFHPDWSLLEGHCYALYWIEGRSSDVGTSIRSGIGLEPLSVRCQKEILLKRDVAYFSGGTILERGPSGQGGLRIEADRVAAKMKPGTRGDKSVSTVEHIEAFDRVNLAWRDLRGRGDLMDLDVATKKIYLRAKTGTCRMTLKGHTMTNRALMYDMERGHVRTYHVKGQIGDRRAKKQ